MGGHYLKHQGRVYVGAALTWDMLLYVKTEASLEWETLSPVY